MAKDYDDEEIEIDFGKIFGKKKTSSKTDDKLNDVKEEVKELKNDPDKKEELKDIQEEIDEEEGRLKVIKEEKKEIEKEEKAEEKRIEKIEKEVDKLKDDEDDVSFDFSGIKNMFKGKKSKTEEIFDDDMSFDIKEQAAALSGFFKNNKWVVPALLIIVAILFSTFFRMYPASLPATDQWAEQNVYNFYKNQISTELQGQYPNLPADQRNSMVNAKFKEYLEQNKATIDAQVKQTSQQFKSRMKYDGEDGNEYTYLLAIDPYLWYGETRNYIENGHFGTDIVEGKEINFLRNGREGKKGNPGSTVHLFAGVLLHRFISIFSDRPLMANFFLLPVIIIGLAVIPAFMIGRKMGGNMGGFFAAMIVAVNAALLSRTPAGFADTDAYNIMFPLFIMWFFLEAFEAKDMYKKISYISLSSLFVGLFSLAWGGWWYTFDFILATMAAYLGYLVLTKLILSNKKEMIQIKQLTINGGLFFVISGLLVIFFNGFRAFSIMWKGPFSIIALKDVGITSLWPNVLTTVAEFNVVPLNTIVSQMGGNLFFWIGSMGLALLLFNRKKPDLKNWIYLFSCAIYYLGLVAAKGNLTQPITFMILLSLPVVLGILKVIFLKEEEIDIKMALLLIIWFLGTAYGFTKGIRFGILMVPAFAVASGVAIGIVYEGVRKWVSKELKVNQTLVSVVVGLLLISILVFPISSAHATGLNELPSMNDAWYSALNSIKDDSDDGIITSWWDFGHWFVAISERRVTFDGADQGERIHWVGKSLLTSDENLAVGILRMLNCGQEKAPHVLEDKLNGDTVKAINVLNEIMVVDRDSAYSILEEEGLSSSDIEDVLAVTHCSDLIPQYYIASEDMIGKAGVWAHFGGWDFKRAKMWQTVRKMDYDKGVDTLKDDFGLTEEQADKYYYEITTTDGDQWISSWPGYMTSQLGCQKNGNILQCVANVQNRQIPVQIDLTTMDAAIPVQEGKAVRPNTFVYATKDSVEEKKYDEAQIGFSVILINEGGSYSIVVASPAVANSMFTRMFYFKGHGLKHFRPLDTRRQITGGMIYVYKVNWDESQPYDAYAANAEEEIKASHILIKTENSARDPVNRTDEEALELVEEIVSKINETNFAEIAAEYSEGPSAPNGGDLGWFGKGMMVPEFENAAFALKEGELAYPVKTAFGYHIIQLDDRRRVGDAVENIPTEDTVVEETPAEEENTSDDGVEEVEIVI